VLFVWFCCFGYFLLLCGSVCFVLFCFVLFCMCVVLCCLCCVVLFVLCCVVCVACARFGLFLLFVLVLVGFSAGVLPVFLSLLQACVLRVVLAFWC